MIYRINKHVLLEESMGRVGTGLIGAGVGANILGGIGGLATGGIYGGLAFSDTVDQAQKYEDVGDTDASEAIQDNFANNVGRAATIGGLGAGAYGAVKGYKYGANMYNNSQNRK